VWRQHGQQATLAVVYYCRTFTKLFAWGQGGVHDMRVIVYVLQNVIGLFIGMSES
jgi:hypothetical protein